MVGLSSFAKVYEFDQKFTSVAALDGQLFTIVNEDEAKAFCFPSNQDMAYSLYSDAMAANSYYFKLEAAEGAGVEGYYYLRTYKPDGTVYAVWGDANNGYFNSQDAGGWCCFSIGKTTKTNGQDIVNGAVWALEENGEGKIALKNIGTGLYLKDAAPAKYEDPTYFTFCTLKEDVVGSAKERYDEIKPMIEALDDDETIFEAGPTVDVSAADAALAAATTVADVDAAIDLLYKAATTFVTSVTVKAGKYFDLSNIWIVNPTVRKNIDGWTIENLSATGGSAGVSNYNETEFYQRTFDFFQTLTLPKGTYEFGVTGFHRAGNHSTYFYAGDDKILVPGVESSVVNSMAQAEEYFNAGNGKVALKFALEDASNTMKIGIVNNDTETDKWTIFRDFTLHYYGSTVDYSVYTDRWNELFADATTAKTTYANVTGVELTNLNTALGNAPGGEDKKADYIAKIEALESALSAFNAAGPAYNNYAAYKAETVAAFGSDLGVAAPTTAAEAVTAVQALNIAQYNKVASEYTFSCSGLIGDFGSWTGTATVAGEAKTPNYLDYEHWSGVIHAYYEQAAEGWGNAAGWTIQYEKICKLPAGDYVIKVAARSSAGTTSLVSCSATSNTVTLPNVGASARGINTSGVASWNDDDTFVVGNNNNTTPAVGGSGKGWQWRFLPFTLTEETNVTMTFYAEATTQYQWMSIADGELLSKTKLAEDVNYTETASNTITDKLIADVTITRDIKEGFNTVVLPFNATANQVKDAFGEGTEVYAYSEDSAEPMDATITFTKGDGSISANVPVLIKATEASTKQVFEGVNIVAADAADVKVAGTNFDFVGTYAPATVESGDWFIGNGAIYKSAGATNINAFRAYIHDKGAGARIIKFVIDGEEVTAIESLEVAGKNNGKLYNLAGQEVKTAQKGLYIQNGKKVIVK